VSSDQLALPFGVASAWAAHMSPVIRARPKQHGLAGTVHPHAHPAKHRGDHHLLHRITHIFVALDNG
jgi:hypothetical protein